MEGCYLLVGEERWLKNQYIQEVKNTVLASTEDLMNFYEASDKEIQISVLNDVVETLPFFAEQKLVILHETGFFKAGKKDETEKFEKLISQLPTYVVLVIDEKEVDKRGKLYKTIKAKYHIKEFDFPGEERVIKILTDLCKQKEVKVTQGTLVYFIRHMPQSIEGILTEWHKVLSYIEKPEITQMDIDTICVFSLETRVFELTKKIANHEIAPALEIYNRMLQSKESPIGILVLMARQFRMMLQAKYLMANKENEKGIAATLKLPYFAVKEMMGQVRSYSFPQLETLINECYKADELIKTGKMEPGACVELLIMKAGI